MLYDDNIIQRICSELVQQNILFMTPMEEVVRDRLSSERTRGGKLKISGFGQSFMERKNCNLFAEVAAALGLELSDVATERYDCEVLKLKVAAASEQLLAALRVTFSTAEFRPYGGREATATVNTQHYAGKAQDISYLDASARNHLVTVKATWDKDKLGLEPQYRLEGRIYSGDPKRSGDTFHENVNDVDDLLLGMLAALARGKAKVQAVWDRRAAARDILKQYRAEFPRDDVRFTPGLRLDVGAAENSVGKVYMQATVHCLGSQLSGTLELMAATAPQGFRDLLESATQAVVSGACGWTQDCFTDNQMHIYASHGRFDLSLSSHYDRPGMVPEGSDEMLVTVRWTGELPLAEALTLTRHLYAQHPAIER